MRRSGAPSQLLGNAVKKPRFVPPGASASSPAAESKPLASKYGLGNALEKVSLIQSLHDGKETTLGLFFFVFFRK
uniref:Uncharacterized protein n=1 Tax=Fundulus heteroclitus TaxID=8078 RepID=A0A3Q2UGN4_FUNHE